MFSNFSLPIHPLKHWSLVSLLTLRADFLKGRGYLCDEPQINISSTALLMGFPGWQHVICMVLTPCIFKCILSEFKELSAFSRSPTDQISVSFSDLSSSFQVPHTHCSFSSYFWTRFISPGSQTCHHLFSLCIPNLGNLMVSVTTYKDNLHILYFIEVCCCC